MKDHCFVVCLMDIGRGKVPEILMGAVIVVMIYVSADLIPTGVFIGITPHDMDLLLFDGTEEPLRNGIIRRSSHPCIREISSHEGEEFLGDKRGIGRSSFRPELGKNVMSFLYPLVFQSHGIEVLYVGGIDRGEYVVSNDIPGEKINEDDEIPPDMIDKQFCPVAPPHEISSPDIVFRFLQRRWSPLVGFYHVEGFEVMIH